MEAEAPPSVSRPAYFGGLAAGLGIAAVGLWVISSLAMGRVAEALSELTVVGAALFTASWIWRKSADAGPEAPLPPGVAPSPKHGTTLPEVDTGPGAPERRERGDEDELR